MVLRRAKASSVISRTSYSSKSFIAQILTLINYEWTLDDPSTFIDRITGIVPMTKVAGQLYEYACHEGNYGMQNILRGERIAEKMAQESGAN